MLGWEGIELKKDQKRRGRGEYKQRRRRV